MSRGRNTESGAASVALRAPCAAPDSERRGKGHCFHRRKVDEFSGVGDRVY